MSDFDDLLETSAQVTRVTWSADQFGAGGSESTSTVATITGSLQPRRVDEPVLAGVAPEQVATHRFYTSSATALKARDRLVIGGQTYEVVGPASDLSALNMGMQRVELRVLEQS